MGKTSRLLSIALHSARFVNLPPPQRIYIRYNQATHYGCDKDNHYRQNLSWRRAHNQRTNCLIELYFIGSVLQSTSGPDGQYGNILFFWFDVDEWSSFLHGYRGIDCNSRMGVSIVWFANELLRWIIGSLIKPVVAKIPNLHSLSITIKKLL